MGIWGEAGVVGATFMSDSEPESRAGVSQSECAHWSEAASSGAKESDSEGAGVSESDHLSQRRPGVDPRAKGSVSEGAGVSESARGGTE